MNKVKQRLCVIKWAKKRDWSDGESYLVVEMSAQWNKEGKTRMTLLKTANWKINLGGGGLGEGGGRYSLVMCLYPVRPYVSIAASPCYGDCTKKFHGHKKRLQ